MFNLEDTFSGSMIMKALAVSIVRTNEYDLSNIESEDVIISDGWKKISDIFEGVKT